MAIYKPKKYMSTSLFYIVLSVLALTLIVTHKFVVIRFPIQSRIGWRVSVAGLSVAIVGGVVAVFLDAINLGASIAWFGVVVVILS